MESCREEERALCGSVKGILIEASPCPPEQKSSFPSAVSALHSQTIVRCIPPGARRIHLLYCFLSTSVCISTRGPGGRSVPTNHRSSEIFGHVSLKVFLDSLPHSSGSFFSSFTEQQGSESHWKARATVGRNAASEAWGQGYDSCTGQEFRLQASSSYVSTRSDQAPALFLFLPSVCLSVCPWA